MPGADYTMPVQGIPSDEVERCGWDELTKRAKQVENELDGHLLTLGRLTSAALRSQRYTTMGGDDGPLRQAEQLAEQVQQGLNLLGRIVEALERRSEQVMTSGTTVGGEGGTAGMGGTGGSSLHMLQRHRDIYNEYRRDYRKTKVRRGRVTGLGTGTDFANTPSSLSQLSSPWGDCCRNT